jgi:hypothetical protein
LSFRNHSSKKHAHKILLEKVFEDQEGDGKIIYERQGNAL